MESTIHPSAPFAGAFVFRRVQTKRRRHEPRSDTNCVRSVRVSRICPSGIESEARFVISLAADDGEHVILGTGTGFQTAEEALGIASEIADFLNVKAVTR